MGMDGVYGKMQASGDLGGGEAVADEEKDFAFAGGEELEVWGLDKLRNEGGCSGAVAGLA